MSDPDTESPTDPERRCAEREEPVRIPVPGGEVSGLLRVPDDAEVLFVFGHGAGTGMRHPFLDAVAEALAERGVATLRYSFPYAERGRKRPDPRPVLLRTAREATRTARSLAPGLLLVAGGKSMGGRMTSLAAAEDPLPGVRGLIFLGFPLHRPSDPSDARADHLVDLDLPMLFLQGTRDRLAELARIRRVCRELGERASLHVVEGADHGFGVTKRSGRTRADVIEELAGAVSEWARDRMVRGPARGTGPRGKA
jgi:predicted alpha/beta-hydrolase family hydrolase